MLVALTPLLRPLPGGPFVKMLLLTVLGLVASFTVAAVAKVTPGLRRIL